MIRHWFSDVPAFRRDPLHLLSETSRRDSRPLVPLALGPRAVLLVNDPALAKPLMRLGEGTIDKGALVHKIGNVVGDSSLTLSGEDHLRRRAILNERLSRGVANSYLDAMAATITSVLVRLGKHNEMRADILGGQMALKLACVALFGHGVLSEADELAIMRAFVTLEADLQAEMFRFLPVAPWKRSRELKRREEALYVISTVIDKVEAGANESSVLVGLRKAGLNPTQIRDELTTLIIAGFHTTGSAVAWLCYFLATQPHAIAALRKEYDQLKNEEGVLFVSRLNEAKSSIAFVKEVLRLYPSAWWFTREIKQTVEFEGHTLKQGTTLLFSPWVYHRNASHFTEPDVFRMDRTFAGAAYMPFGVGHRACVGMGVAMVELQIIALEVAAAFDLRISRRQSLIPRAGITLNAPEIIIDVQLRDHGSQANVIAA